LSLATIPARVAQLVLEDQGAFQERNFV